MDNRVLFVLLTLHFISLSGHICVAPSHGSVDTHLSSFMNTEWACNCFYARLRPDGQVVETHKVTAPAIFVVLSKQQLLTINTIFTINL